MPASRLQQQLQDLREQLAEQPPLSEEERAELYVLTQEIEVQLARQAAAAPDATLIDGVNLAVERFEASHPTLAGTLPALPKSVAKDAFGPPLETLAKAATIVKRAARRPLPSPRRPGVRAGVFTS